MTVWETLPFDHPARSLVGQIATRQADCEHVVRLIAMDMLELPQSAAAKATAHLVGIGKIAAFAEKAAKDRGIPQAAVSAIRAFAQALLKDGAKRNRYVHDPWQRQKGTEVLAQYRLMDKSTEDFGMRVLDPSELHDTLASLNDLWIAAGKLRALVLDERSKLKAQN